jgi:hypothetical protein
MYCLLRYLQLESDNSSNSLITSNTTQVGTLPIEASLYWLGFVIFLYALPLTIIVILYGLMLKFLRGARGQSVGKSKRRAIRMILAVILTYALCWFFMQLLFISNIILSRNTSHHFATYMDILTTFANVFAYLNSVCCRKREKKKKKRKLFLFFSVQIQYFMDLCQKIFVHHLLIYFVVDIQNEIFLELMKV